MYAADNNKRARRCTLCFWMTHKVHEFGTFNSLNKNMALSKDAIVIKIAARKKNNTGRSFSIHQPRGQETYDYRSVRLIDSHNKTNHDQRVVKRKPDERSEEKRAARRSEEREETTRERGREKREKEEIRPEQAARWWGPRGRRSFWSARGSIVGIGETSARKGRESRAQFSPDGICLGEART